MVPGFATTSSPMEKHVCPGACLKPWKARKNALKSQVIGNSYLVCCACKTRKAYPRLAFKGQGSKFRPIDRSRTEPSLERLSPRCPERVYSADERWSVRAVYNLLVNIQAKNNGRQKTEVMRTIVTSFLSGLKNDLNCWKENSCPRWCGHEERGSHSPSVVARRRHSKPDQLGSFL